MTRFFSRATWHRVLGGASAFLCLFAPVPGDAQQPSSCESGRISYVFIDNHSVFDLSDPDLNRRFDWAYRIANRLHFATREDVIRRELLFAEGDCYDVERLRDSERLLRLLPFLASVDIFGVRQVDGSIHVIVDTQDEWSTRVQPKLASDGQIGLRGIRLREDNLLGRGQRVSAFYIDDEEDKVYGLGFQTPQLFGTRWDAGLEVGRTEVGYLLSEAILYPFVGEVGRWAMRQAIRHSDHFFEYWMPVGNGDLAAIWFPERRQIADFGIAYRWGERGDNRTLLGGALTGEWRTYPAVPRFADSEERFEGPLPAAELAVDSLSSLRAVLMFGQRNVYYVRRRALDTVNGTEDVRLGLESEMSLGPSLPAVSHDQDLALDFGVYAAGEITPEVLGGAHLVAEARRNYDAAPGDSEWNDVFLQLHAWGYWRTAPDSRHTLVGTVSAVGGWHTVVPFQLTLGADTGLRGYPRRLYPGGRRIVASLEQRSYLGWPLPDLFDLGAVAFADIGRIWAGDVPFGQSSSLQANVGLGLRAAFPPGSRQTLRLDVGVPLRSGAGIGDVVISVGIGQLIGSRGVRRDPQLARSTRQGISSSLFVFPDQR